MASIHRNSPLPLYYQVAQSVRTTILSGDIEPNTEIPSERELKEDFQVSRHTIRQAIDLLVSEGLVRRVQGRGSFVLPEGLSVRSRIDTFFEHLSFIREFGYKSSVQRLSTDIYTPDENIMTSLNLNPEDKVVCYSKLFLADGNPAILAKDHIPEKNIQVSYQQNGAGDDYFNFLESMVGERVEYLLSDIVPIAATGEIAETFQCPEGTPILLLKELFLDSTQQIPIQYAYNYHHPNFIHYSILRNRREP